MSATVVEYCNGFEIAKLHSPDKTKVFGYRVMPRDYDGTDASKVVIKDNLTAARKHAGFNPLLVPTKETAPKTSYEQNRKGYRADTTGSKKGK